jgi:hypothetical protein
MPLSNSKLKLVLAGLVLLALFGGLIGWTLFRRTPEHGNFSFDVAPDGTQIAFAAADGNLYSFDLNTRKVATMVRHPCNRFPTSTARPVRHLTNAVKWRCSPPIFASVATRSTCKSHIPRLP